MQSSLIFSDSKKLVEKYTRFMTKDIYISYKMNESFLEQFLYLKNELEKNKYLYQEQMDYKKVFNIYKNKNSVLKLHNQKYLKHALSNYESFFETLYPKEILDKNKQMMVISSEEEMLAIVKKNYIPLIVSKIKYMYQYLHKNLEKILVLVEDERELVELKKELDIYELEDVSLFSLKEYGLSMIGKDESMLDRGSLYQLLLNYITVDLFSDKKHFRKFYEMFSNDIYLNKDYKDFDTFRDYHYYMYKRMFLESKLSLKQFIERETKKRRGQLRTIDNTFVNDKEEVNVANFLYLNSITYSYDKEKSCFICHSKNLRHMIVFDGKDIQNEGYEVISLDRGTKFLEVLAYELIKRQYGMEKRSDDEVFGMLRDTTIDSYFSEFITNILIPSIQYYQKNHSFDGTVFTKEQIKELELIHHCYIEFKKKKSFLDDEDIHQRVQNKLDQDHYEYHIMLGDSSFQLKKQYFIILKNYPELNLLKENIRLLYDYKTYLNEKKILVMPHTYLNFYELSHLTGMFFKDNLNYLNEQMEKNKKNICICFYDDSSKLKYSLNLTEMVTCIVESEQDKNISLVFHDMKEIKGLLYGNYFTKVSQNKLQSEYGMIECFELSNILKREDIVILPFLIKDIYHQDIVWRDEVYQVKVGLFMTLSKCREKVYLLCPVSKKEKYLKVFSGLDYVEYSI